MKKVLSLFLVLIFAVFLFTGCKSDSEDDIIIPTISTDKMANPSSVTPTIGDTPKPVSEGFFDNTIFVGDSITLGLQNYTMNERNNGNECLGKAEFLCSGSLSFYNSMWDKDDPNNVHPYFNGTQYTVVEGVAALQPERLFIKLGTNDLGMSGVDGTMEDAKKLFDLILDAKPDVLIYIEAVTPILESGEVGSLNNENIRLLNTKLKELCDEKGWRFIDLYTPLADENGYLIREYCGDPDGMGIHIMGDGYKIWVDTIEQNAG